MDLNREPERLKLANDVDHAGVADVGNVFLEGQPKDGDYPILSLAP